jgi:hypothetical protein
MLGVRVATVLVAASFASASVAQSPVTGTLETFWVARSGEAGARHRLSWAEFHWRFHPRMMATASYTDMSVRRMLDEICLRFDGDREMVRVGRLRTAFGFSDWTELYYNGFNNLPLVRSTPIMDGIRLARNDSGVELTHFAGSFQVQAALVDAPLSEYQILPERPRYGMVRLQWDLTPVIAGLNLMAGLDSKRRITGLDLRWTAPRVQVRGETFLGSGEARDASGYYVDAAYRIPRFSRTQAVARTEGFSRQAQTFRQHTLGLRQLIGATIGLNLNYAWSEGVDPGRVGVVPTPGWSLQGMYRITF